MTQRFFVDQSGLYLGSYDGPDDSIPDIFVDAVVVPSSPNDVSQKWDGDKWDGYIKPNIKSPSTVAMGKLTIEDETVKGFAADSAVAGGFILETGKFMMFFIEPQVDADYIVSVFDGGLYRCYVLPEDYTTDYFIITTTDMQGTSANPGTMSLIITRAI